MLGLSIPVAAGTGHDHELVDCTDGATAIRRPSCDRVNYPGHRGEREPTVLDLLADEGCRAILAATSADARSATELAEECDLPLSTVYRKLDRLTAADLLAERTRICTTGSHEREFVRRVDDVRLGFDPTGDVTLEVTSRSNRDGSPGRTGP